MNKKNETSQLFTRPSGSNVNPNFLVGVVEAGFHVIVDVVVEDLALKLLAAVVAVARSVATKFLNCLYTPILHIPSIMSHQTQRKKLKWQSTISMKL